MTRETRNADIRIQAPSCQAGLDGYSTKIGEREAWLKFGSERLHLVDKHGQLI